MTERTKKYLFDIHRSIEAIDEYIGEERSFELFKESKIVRRAVEREFEIIGEAVNRLLKLENPPTITNARRIVDLRNYIIYVYDEVEEEILWGIIMKNLPVLKEEVASFLES